MRAARFGTKAFLMMSSGVIRPPVGVPADVVAVVYVADDEGNSPTMLIEES
jgi:hypothetical protein